MLEWSLWAQRHLEPWIQRDQSLVEVMRAVGGLREGVVHTSLTALERTIVSAAAKRPTEDFGRP